MCFFLDTNVGCYSVPQSRPGSRQSCNSSEAESVQLEPEVAKQIQDELTCSQSWQDTISLDDRLSLTLSEIVHIRTVLTKAELDALPVEGKVTIVMKLTNNVKYNIYKKKI